VSSGQTNSLREFIEQLLDGIAVIQADKERPLSAEIMAGAIIEHLASPAFWTEKMKAQLYTLILPTVQQWLNKR
jgi:hypothetical protein